MDNKILISDSNLKSITREMVQDLLTKIKNKDISLPYTTQLSKSSYLKIDGLGNMFLNNGGNYIEIGNIEQDRLDIDKIYSIFNIINQQEQWDTNTYANMPTARYNVISIVYGNRIYCIGGNNSSGTLSKVEVYDIASNTWSSNYNNMPTIRYGFGCVEYNGKIYCIGGRDSSGSYIGNVEVYDIASNTWSTNYNSMPYTRTQFGCVQYDGKIYCIGGFNIIRLNKVEVYDITSNTWSSNYNNMPTIRYGFGCVEYNGKIYCIGGYNTTILNKIEVYDIASNAWSTNYNPMPTIRYIFGCIEYNGKIYCIGGDSGSISNIVEIYDTISDSWTINKPMKISRYGFGCIEYNGKIYCIGGYSSTGYPGYLDIMEVLLLKILTFNIPIPDSLYSKLNEIITNGDGTKVFHNNGKYSTITPTYQVLSSDQINNILNNAFLEGGA